MTTKLELAADLDDRISAASVSGFWKATTKDRWLNQAGQRVCDWYAWTFLQLALTIESASSREYYDYPSGELGFKENSIYNIIVEDEDYPAQQNGRERVTWDEFQQDKQQDASRLIFTNHNGFYFLHPIPENGKQISLWGIKKWQTLVGDDDEAITPSGLDESIVRIALASCLRKAKKYSEAKAELVEVLDPQVGTLALYRDQMESHGPSGYGGRAHSSRFN